MSERTVGELPQSPGNVRLRPVRGDPEVRGDDPVADERVGRERQLQRCQRRAAAHPLVDIEVAGIQHGHLEVGSRRRAVRPVARHRTAAQLWTGSGAMSGTMSGVASTSASEPRPPLDRPRRRAASPGTRPTWQSRRPRRARGRRAGSCAMGHRRAGGEAAQRRTAPRRRRSGRASRQPARPKATGAPHPSASGPRPRDPRRRATRPGRPGSASLAEASPVVAGRRWVDGGESSCRARTCEWQHCPCRDQGEPVHDDPRVEHLTPSRTLAGVVVKQATRAHKR